MFLTIVLLIVAVVIFCLACISAVIIDFFSDNKSPYLHIYAKKEDCDLIVKEFGVYDFKRVDNILRIPVEVEDLVCRFIVENSIEVKII